jgi:hypothetical protein
MTLLPPSPFLGSDVVERPAEAPAVASSQHPDDVTAGPFPRGFDVDAFMNDLAGERP